MRIKKIIIIAAVLCIISIVFFKYIKLIDGFKNSIWDYEAMVVYMNWNPSITWIDKKSDICADCISFMKKNNIHNIIRMNNGDIVFLKSWWYNKLQWAWYMYSINDINSEEYKFIIKDMWSNWYKVELY